MDSRKKRKISRSGLIKKIDYFFAKFIKNRDNYTCITCGRYYPQGGKKINVGHYVSRRVYRLRWNEINSNAQCSYCNHHLSGDIITYREKLIEKYGIEKVHIIEKMRHTKITYTMDELNKLLDEYIKKCEEIKN